MENKVLCADCKKSCNWYKEGYCSLLNTENSNCSFFKTRAQVRDDRRLRQKLNQWRIR